MQEMIKPKCAKRCKWNLIKTEGKDTETKYCLQDKERGLIKHQPCAHYLVFPASRTDSKYPCLELSTLLSEPKLPNVPRQAHLLPVSIEVSVIPIIVPGRPALHSLVPHITSFLGQHLSFRGNSDRPLSLTGELPLDSRILHFNFSLNIIPPQFAFFIRVFLSSSISAILKYPLSPLASFPTGRWLSFGRFTHSCTTATQKTSLVTTAQFHLHISKVPAPVNVQTHTVCPYIIFSPLVHGMGVYHLWSQWANKNVWAVHEPTILSFSMSSFPWILIGAVCQPQSGFL